MSLRTKEDAVGYAVTVVILVSGFHLMSIGYDNWLVVSLMVTAWAISTVALLAILKGRVEAQIRRDELMEESQR